MLKIDYPKPGIQFRDITTLLADRKGLVDDREALHGHRLHVTVAPVTARDTDRDGQPCDHDDREDGHQHFRTAFHRPASLPRVSDPRIRVWRDAVLRMRCGADRARESGPIPLLGLSTDVRWFRFRRGSRFQG